MIPVHFWDMLLRYKKAPGGFRPTGLLPTIVRLWESCRKTNLWDWEAANQRGYNWAAPGKSSFTVVAHQCLAVESTGKDGVFIFSLALSGLVKAYELVPQRRAFDGARVSFFFLSCALTPPCSVPSQVFGIPPLERSSMRFYLFAAYCFPCFLLSSTTSFSCKACAVARPVVRCHVALTPTCGGESG